MDKKPLFWYRPCSDGAYEGPIHDSSIEEVRKQSGAWKPLFDHSGDATDMVAEIERLRPLADEVQAARHVMREHNRLLVELSASQYRERQLRSVAAVPEALTQEPLRGDEPIGPQASRADYVRGWNACRNAMLSAAPAAPAVAADVAKDAERYRWLRDRLAIEDIDRLVSEFFGTPDEAESVKTDAAIDAAMQKGGE